MGLVPVSWPLKGTVGGGWGQAQPLPRQGCLARVGQAASDKQLPRSTGSLSLQVERSPTSGRMFLWVRKRPRQAPGLQGCGIPSLPPPPGSLASCKGAGGSITSFPGISLQGQPETLTICRWERAGHTHTGTSMRMHTQAHTHQHTRALTEGLGGSPPTPGPCCVVGACAGTHL